ncbi:MAG: SurA N-terminal domain-containing protein, partial [Bacteroidetes bacterium]|nr:SurA N-terminal domain-containing protein [Bacteroidota bacterium]
MAIINKMREKMGKLIVLAVGFAIVSFIAADLTGPNSVLFGGQSLEIGEISGEEISLDEFRAQVDDLTYNFTLN